MSNLGGYQLLTTIAKKVGGPKNLVGLLIGGGIGVGVGATKVYDKISDSRKNKKEILEKSKVYEVHKKGTSNQGLEFKEGDEFRVLANDKDAILIELIGDKNNQYFVSYDLLKSISDYRK